MLYKRASETRHTCTPETRHTCIKLSANMAVIGQRDSPLHRKQGTPSLLEKMGSKYTGFIRTFILTGQSVGRLALFICAVIYMIQRFSLFRVDIIDKTGMFINHVLVFLPCNTKSSPQSIDLLVLHTLTN